MLLVFGRQKTELKVIGHKNTSFHTSKEDYKSHSGFVFMLNGLAINWKSSKQCTMADSSTEARYIAENDARKEVVQLRNFIVDLEVVPGISGPAEIFYDNLCVVAQAKEPRAHLKSKHILRKYHFIREIVDQGDVKVQHNPMDDNATDPFTKAVWHFKHYKHAEFIGMKYL